MGSREIRRNTRGLKFKMAEKSTWIEMKFKKVAKLTWIEIQDGGQMTSYFHVGSVS